MQNFLYPTCLQNQVFPTHKRKILPTVKIAELLFTFSPGKQIFIQKNPPPRFQNPCDIAAAGNFYASARGKNLCKRGTKYSGLQTGRQNRRILTYPLEVGRRVLADGACEIGRQNIFLDKISANLAPEAFDAVLDRFRLYIFEVICIGDGFFAG